MLSADYRLSQISPKASRKCWHWLTLSPRPGRRIVGAVVFDDPVNSLDHRRLQEVADRIARLVSTRQVVVFTHNIWLATELLARFEKRPGSARTSWSATTKQESMKGRVDRATGPRWDTVRELKKRVDEHPYAMPVPSGASQSALIEAAYGEMRSWCEVVVEERLFGDVTRRYGANVMMGGC